MAMGGQADAAIPTTITEQGRLLNMDGTSATGTINMTSSVYANAAGGTALWTETQSVTLDDGYFTVQLGSMAAFPVSLWDGTRYIGVQIDKDSEMMPRAAISSVPYALVANEVSGDIHPRSVTVNGVRSSSPTARSPSAPAPAALWVRLARSVP